MPGKLFDQVFVSVVCGVELIIAIRYLMKALGMRQYQSDEDEKLYKLWLARWGFRGRIAAILAILITISFWVWFIASI